MLIISSTLYPFFNTAINLNLILVSVSSLLIGFFYFNPPEKRRIRLLIGIVSIILGCVIVIFSLFGILSFSIYLEGLDLEGAPASVLNLNLVFVGFILVGIGLIIHGVLQIKKRDIEKDRYHPTDL